VRSLALVVVACIGCASAQARKTRHVGEIGMAGGILGVLGCVVVGEADEHDRGVFILGGAGLSLVVVASAVTYLVANAMVDDDPPRHRPMEHSPHYDAAMDLAKQAKRAARAGDCAEVQAIEPRVRSLDETIYLRFLRDPVIRTCRAPAAATD
jgi:hypothetical protein